MNTIYIKKKSIFKPDNSHLHHVINNKFNGDRILPLIIFLLTNSSIIFLGYKISEISKLLSLSVFIIGFIFFFIMRFFLFKEIKN